MTIREIVEQGFHYARTCRWLWLFGFFVGLASGGSGGGGRESGNGSGGLALPAGFIPLIAAGIIVLAVASIVMRFVGEGALIEGIVRARRGRTMTTGEGFRAGWAHWGVLVRIALLYLGATVGSVALLAAPCVIAMKLFGLIGAMLFGVPALVVAVPWLITLYLVQAFASRIAVLENRQAFDAIVKARLFLHGRLTYGLKLLVATLVGTLGITLVGAVVLGSVVLVLVALLPFLRAFGLIVLGGLVLLPAAYVLVAILGTFRSSVWTIGYVTQVDA